MTKAVGHDDAAAAHREREPRERRKEIAVPCSRCGAEIPDGRIVCPACGGQAGAALPRAEPGEPDAMTRALLPVGRSVWAIAAGYLGLLSVLGCVAPVAVVIGIVAVVDVRRHEHKHGMGRAVFGIVMGALFTLLYALGMIGAGVFSTM